MNFVLVLVSISLTLALCAAAPNVDVVAGFNQRPGTDEDREEIDFVGDIAYLKDNADRNFRPDGSGSTWPKGVVPYVFDETWPLSAAERNAVEAAFNELAADVGCLTFLRMTDTSCLTNYIKIERGDGCWSFAGMLGIGMQRMSLGQFCQANFVYKHEMIHALGFHHEMTRPDRDNYVNVYFQNMANDADLRRQYDIIYGQTDTPYDYLSVMHYERMVGSINGLPTMVRKNDYYGTLNGRQTTNYDIAKIKSKYCSS